MSKRSFISATPVPVYVVTSSPAPLPQNLCAAIPALTPLVSRIVSGDQFNPDKAAGLEVAIEMMGLAPHQVIYVGDARSDLAAARKAGCGFVYYLREPDSADPEIPADVPRISRHGDLLELSLGEILGVAYDMDGTIFGTVALHEEAWRAAGREFGVAITTEFLKLQMGKKNEEAAAWLLGERYAAIGSAFIAVKEAFVASNSHRATYFEDFSDALAALTRA